MKQKEIIIITDGDSIAKKAIEVATKNIGGRCISVSSGNPTLLSGCEILNLVETAANNPVVIMVDDCGDKEEGKGEEALQTIINSKMVKLLGVIAVASNDCDESGVPVNFSIDKSSKIVQSAVDKFGNATASNEIFGDTVSVLNKYRDKVPVIIGIGDPGKMDKKDSWEMGSPITTKALNEIIKFNKK